MMRTLTFASMGLLLSVVSACGSSSTAGTGSPTPTGASSPTSQASGTPVSYDPCVLVNVKEASNLTGVNYPPGREDIGGATKLCEYGYQTKDVFNVGIVQAPDQATVQADETKAQAALQAQAGAGLSFTQLQGVGDLAYEVQASRSANGTTIALSGIYVVKGLIFFFITDVAVNQAVPSNSALQGEAMIVLTRL